MQIGRFILRSGLSTNISGIGHVNVTTPTRVLTLGELGMTTDDSLVYIGTNDGDKQLLTRVKGNAETTYRSGDVNITKGNIGLGNVENTADKDKKVEYASYAGGMKDAAGSADVPIYFPEPDPEGVYDQLIGKRVIKSLPTPITSIARRLLTGTYDIDITGTAANANRAASAASADVASKLDPNKDAGGLDTPVFFEAGIPKVVTSIKRALLTGTYDINITGNAATATKANYINVNAPVGSATNPVYVAYDSANQRGVITKCNQASSGNYKSFVPAVDANGTMEVGDKIDFHTNTGSTDYDIRLTATTGALNCSGTFTATKVFNAVWNDYADALPKENIVEDIKYGTIVEINPVTKKYRSARHKSANLVVGVCSNTYGHLLGGKEGMSEDELLKEFVPVAVAGNVSVYVIGKIKAGDLITVSKLDGIGKKASRWFHKPGTILGKALVSSNNKDLKKVLMQVSLM